MKQHLIKLLRQALQSLQQDGSLPPNIHQPQVEQTRDPQHGDFASNIALLLAKSTQQNPRDLANRIIQHLPASKQVKQVVVAGPGFINFFMAEDAFFSVIPNVLTHGNNYGRSHVGQDAPIHVEFVSCNPNGPLHVGHGRGAAYGACVANLLDAVGYKAHREYYVNDAGRQMDIVTVSIWLRYLQECGYQLPFPAAGYKGDYVMPIARQLKGEKGDTLVPSIEEIFVDLPPDAQGTGDKEKETRDKEAHIDALIARTKNLLGHDQYRYVFHLGLNNILADIRNDLEEFGVTFQNWFHESSLVASGALERCIDLLRQKGQLYKKDGALWFKASAFGDEKDRVVVRENGVFTYFAADMANHLNKFERGFVRAIDVFGSDHHGYAPRIKAFLQAVEIPADKLTVLLVQFAILYRGKEKVSMSTRHGDFVTLRELRHEVGNDAARFFYIMRKPEQHLDFDLELAKSQSSNNPVYYIQYAHARVCSVLRQLEVKNLPWDPATGLAHLVRLTNSHEQILLRQLAQYPEIVHNAALNYEPHLLAHYLQELANGFHTYYNSCQFLVEDAELRNARLALIIAVRQVIANGLKLLGVSAPEVM